MRLPANFSPTFLGSVGPSIANDVGLGAANQGSVPLGPVLDPARIPVAYAEKWPGSPKFPRVADNSSQMQRIYRIPWISYWDAVKDLLGYPQIVERPEKSGKRYISRYLPDSAYWLSARPSGFNFDKDRPFLWCTDLSIEPFGDVPADRDPVTDLPVCIDEFGVGTYDQAEIIATYETLSYEIMSDKDMASNGFVDTNSNPDESSLNRYVTIQPGPTARYQTLPQGSFVVVATGGTYPGTPGRLEVQADLSITWHHIPSAAVPLRFINPYLANTTKVNGQDIPYVPAIEDCLGTVNKVSIAGSKIGTLLLTAAVLKPIRSAIGMRLWDIEYRWSWFPVKSATQLASGISSQDYQYGHNLVLEVDNGLPPGYYEICAPTIVMVANGDTTNGSPTIAVDSTAGLAPGQFLRGKGIPAKATILKVNDNTTFDISSNATVTGNQALTIWNPISSNYLGQQSDLVNLFSYRDHTALFKVPALKFDPGNT